jgi:3-oxoacyl-[acyl-carrier protein] reductase
MSLPFQGKSALVTGSSRGIGRAIAERLGADGAAVVINYARNKQPAQTVVNNILETGGKAIAIQADISKPAEVRRMFSEAEKAMGRLDIVIANAGVHIEKPFIENSEADYDSIFDVNTKGVFFTLQEAARVRDGAALSSFRRAARKCFRQYVALSWKQRGHRAVCAFPVARTRPAQCDGKRPVAGIHRYRHAPQAVPRLWRESVALQSCRRAGGCSRRGRVSRE